MRLVGTYFDLTDRFAPNPAGGARPVDVKAGGHGKGDKNSSTIVISVAKRLVPSAVRRNTVKRIVREAWRAASGESGQSSQQGAEDGSARPSFQHLPAGQAAAGSVRVCLVRLKRYPGKDLKAVKRKAARRRAAKALPTSVTGHSTAPAEAVAVATVIGLAAIKRSLRSDADELFAAFLSGRPRHRRSPGASSGAFGAGASLSSGPPAVLENL